MSHVTCACIKNTPAVRLDAHLIIMAPRRTTRCCSCNTEVSKLDLQGPQCYIAQVVPSSTTREQHAKVVNDTMPQAAHKAIRLYKLYDRAGLKLLRQQI